MDDRHEKPSPAENSSPTSPPSASVNPSLSGATPEFREKLINRFFVRMANIYGHLWTSRFRSEDQLSVAQKRVVAGL